MGRACLPGAFLSTLTAAALIERAGNSAQRAKYLEPIAAGELKATVALLEESASWDVDAIKLKATRREVTFIFQGENFSYLTPMWPTF